MPKIAEEMLKLTKQLSKSLNNIIPSLNKHGIEYCYNPHTYAFKPYEKYVHKYCFSEKKILFIGMNPSPSGMCQTGIPFGEINAVKNWLKVCETVEKPTRECPNRPVLGFSFQISEVSGLRLWGLFRKLCVSPEQLFKHSFVNNYCPLAFFNENGVNIPSAQLTGSCKENIEEICNKYLEDTIDLLEPIYLVAIGRYVEKICQNVVKTKNYESTVYYLQHPSPQFIKNHEQWIEIAEQNLKQKSDLFKLLTA